MDYGSAHNKIREANLTEQLRVLAAKMVQGRAGISAQWLLDAADVIEKLTDPVAVHANMLAGRIAKPSVENILHLYPELKRERDELRAALERIEQTTRSGGPTMSPRL